MNGTATIQAVTAAFHAVDQAVMPQQLLDRYGRFEGLEVAELGSVHYATTVAEVSEGALVHTCPAR